MSVTVRDFRNHVDGADKVEKPKPVTQLLAQAQSDVPATGDDRLDKFIRVIQASLEATEAHYQEVAIQANLAANAEQHFKMRLEFMFTKGLIEAYKAMQQIPAKILEEETPRHSA